MVTSKKTPYRWIRLLMLSLNAVAIISLFLAYATTLIGPSFLWFITLFGLAYPLILFINILFIGYWLFLKRWYFLISFLSIIIGYSHLNHFIHLNFHKNRNLSNIPTFKVMSYNVKNFGLYDYNKDWSINHSKRFVMVDYINKQKADILCLQEFVYLYGGHFPTLDTLISLQPKYQYHAKYPRHNRGNYFGGIILSKYPIIDKGFIPFKTKFINNCIYADLLIYKDTIRVYNVHFESIGFKHEDYEFAKDVKNMEDIQDKEKIKKNSFRMLKQIKQAYLRRSAQVSQVYEHMQSCPHPYIICGDFNDPSVSYTYKKISNKLTDSFVESGRGIGHTYNGIFPFLRIDNILYSKELQSFNHERNSSIKVSDHFPISCEIGFREPIK